MRAEVFFGDIIGCHIHYSGWYELPVVRAVVPFLGPDTVFVDVGANIGQYTLLASPFVRQVIAFEPNPATYALLEGNVRRNRLRNVSLYQAAVSSSDGEAFIFDSDPGNHGGASMQGAEGGKGSQLAPSTRFLTSAPARKGVSSSRWTSREPSWMFSVGRRRLSRCASRPFWSKFWKLIRTGSAGPARTS